jgi:hypothetical protein
MIMNYFHGNQEILIFSLVLFSSKISFQILNEELKNQKFALILLLLSFNSALWIKNEGIIFNRFHVISYFNSWKFKLILKKYYFFWIYFFINNKVSNIKCSKY